MQQAADNTPRHSYEEGHQLIQQNYKVFRTLLSQAKDLAQRGKYSAAAVYGQMAASYAQSNHCGLFVSHELEQLIIMIGRQATSPNLYPHNTSALPSNPKNILHVSSIAPECAGIPRLMRRWIQQDSLRSHSVVLTKHAPNEIPQILRDAVAQRQGRIYLLNEKPGGLLARAERLRECAASADVVVLHTWEHDIVPTIAFANKKQSPPIIYTNHGDHWFWIGANVSDVVANLRESGMGLSQERRGIEAKRNMLLPTILEPFHRALSRTEAKRQLGIDENSVLLLSIARAVKYKTSDGTTFADAHVSLLKQYKQAVLVVIGPGSHEDWSAAIEQTQGRIQVLGETPDTAVFYQAADIYVDSFPFVSITSLLEAGSYSVPLVSRYAHTSAACGIFGADMPGLTGNLIRVSDLDGYEEVLSRLIENEAYRLSLGEMTRQKIEETHWGSNWQSSLENVYANAIALPRVVVPSDSTDKIFLGEPDIFLPLIHKTSLTQIIHWHMSLLPLMERLHLWLRLIKKNGLRNTPSNLLMPEWLRSRYYRLRSR
ncbi:glycosyl transferase family 1 [Phormidesmis priestleyi ULC007]|uniref:Glycosyl transferase family 1 n=1 Tax=Phormidesmis priestleyi ULC007 TaxID=1920490 RepID=A0A2T1D586_9CYAN|nr:glycosyltransferase family 4 protein [Phormidesmis priestleyi]PSB15639.1 glycosyl transferase family 1 [Phormidesmis priestleyi ULC007]